MMKPSTKIFLSLKIAGYILLPVILLILPADFFDGGPSMCVSVLLLGKECLGCGLTRSIMHLLHFEFQEAYFYNVLGFVVFPLLAWCWARWAWKDFRKLKGFYPLK